MCERDFCCWVWEISFGMREEAGEDGVHFQVYSKWTIHFFILSIISRDVFVDLFVVFPPVLLIFFLCFINLAWRTDEDLCHIHSGTSRHMCGIFVSNLFMFFPTSMSSLSNQEIWLPLVYFLFLFPIALFVFLSLLFFFCLVIFLCFSVNILGA